MVKFYACRGRVDESEAHPSIPRVQSRCSRIHGARVASDLFGRRPGREAQYAAVGTGPDEQWPWGRARGQRHLRRSVHGDAGCRLLLPQPHLQGTAVRVRRLLLHRHCYQLHVVAHVDQRKDRPVRDSVRARHFVPMPPIACKPPMCAAITRTLHHRGERACAGTQSETSLPYARRVS